MVVATETVTVCQRHSQWGILFECGDFVTSYHRELRSRCTVDRCHGKVHGRGLCIVHYAWRYRNRLKMPPTLPKHFVDKEHVLEAVEHIKLTYRNEYGDELPWRVEVVG